ncbi:uncharacterized protein LOC111289786 [Durio zibethinus]|uniref:Uncharacterized protein LOC111289786 n=1 Tax=Durio zibethinus TaxID=66656 RepID=A0A6P5Y8M7_DURZI|nr:uncharacterized protein LOC111289786 [Durio zibethinus]
MENRWRLQISESESMDWIGVKLTILVSRQEQVKIAYHQLKSQIKIGLAEAEEVFASLAIPLMKLVGLKTEEMAEEGRFTTIFVDDDFSCGFHRNGPTPQSPMISPSSSGGEWNNQRKKESCASKAIVAGKEFFEKQQTQLMQLVRLLRQVENGVNSHQDDILQSLATERDFLQKLFRKAIYYISAFHNQNHDTFLITLKLFQLIFDKTDAVLNSVEDGMEGLMQDLAERMCDPMVEYVKGLKADLKIGTCARLLAIVDEMERSMRSGRIELEEARKRVRVAEEGRIKALCKLKETEEKVRRMKEYHEFHGEIQKEHIEHLVSQKFLGMEETEANQNKLAWELRRKMRKFRTPRSPMGPKELLYFESNKKHHQSTRERPSSYHRLVIGSHLQSLGPETPCLDTRIPLGLSPSPAIQRVVSRKRISPCPRNP